MLNWLLVSYMVSWLNYHPIATSLHKAQSRVSSVHNRVPDGFYRWIPKRWTSSHTQQKKNDSQINIALHATSYRAGWQKGFPPLCHYPKFPGLSLAPKELKYMVWDHMLPCFKYNTSISCNSIAGLWLSKCILERVRMGWSCLDQVKGGFSVVGCKSLTTCNRGITVYILLNL